MIAKINKTYENLIDLTSPYLGPSSERFINRQIRNHLNKEPEEINRDDIALLVDWIRLSMSILTDDNKLIKEYIKQIKSLYQT
jgi:hypothetical protein